MLTAICYISNKANTLQHSQIEHLFRFTKNKNSLNGITGFLISKNNHFFQIMEGETTLIKNTFKKVRKDKRHHGVIKLLELPIEQRIFQAFDSGHFSIIDNPSHEKKLKLYFDWIAQADNLAADKLIKITTNFLDFCYDS